MGRKNIIAGVILMMIGIIYGYLTSQLPVRPVTGEPGISFFPWIITIAVLILSLAMTIQGWRAIRQEEAALTWQPPSLQVVATLLLFMVYIAALPYLGFLIASVPFFIGLMVLYGGRHKTLLILAGPGVPIALYFLFRHVFLIPLPRATLTILGG